MIERHNTGAATLLIHMLANVATNIFDKSTKLGFVPALDNTKVAMILAIWYLLNAPAIAKPPKSNIITGENMAWNIYLVASCAGSWWWLSSLRKTPKHTANKGTKSEVTNSGITLYDSN